MRRSISSKAKPFLHRNLPEKANPPSYAISDSPRRAHTSSSNNNNTDYKETLRSNKLRHMNLDDSLELFFHMIQRRPFPSIADFSRLLTAISKLNSHDVVIHLYEQMEILGVPHNLYTCNILLNCLCRCSELSQALSFLAKMIKLGHTPSVVTFGSLIGGFCRVGRVSEALRLFNQMVEIGVRPNVVIYNIVIDGLCKSRHVDKALDFFNQMEVVRPDVITYNSLISGLCNASRWGEALRMVRCMSESGLSPDVFTFNALIDACVKRGSLSEAEELYEEMVRRSLEPDVVTYSLLIDGLCMCSRFDEAERMFEYMVEKALVMLEDMEKSGMEGDIVTYNIIIRGMCKAGEVADAWDLYCSLNLKGLVPDIWTYTTMMLGLYKKGLRREADAGARLGQAPSSEMLAPGKITQIFRSREDVFHWNEKLRSLKTTLRFYEKS
ncbi:hypothetical protein F2Q69_00044728 [Brassica cretica]|uniref:Pentacotripeptide-repeat region of PRORP domain-containing protein n=1 Tax=Brassica cretica TaxID=69181 RepID=A0A8S9NRV1_BRACR|nr:hypothetical protein F2Q69_00044728 [Brassica cretica]